MKKQNTNEDYDTQMETCSATKKSKLTTVKTIYARAAIVLLALNFCLTGYVVYTMNQATQAQIDSITGAAATSREIAQQTATTQETLQTTSQESTTPTPVTTRDQ